MLSPKARRKPLAAPPSSAKLLTAHGNIVRRLPTHRGSDDCDSDLELCAQCVRRRERRNSRSLFGGPVNERPIFFVPETEWFRCPRPSTLIGLLGEGERAALDLVARPACGATAWGRHCRNAIKRKNQDVQNHFFGINKSRIGIPVIR